MFLGILAIAQIGCKEYLIETESQPVLNADPRAVGFNFKPMPAEEGKTLWLASYASQGKVAQFLIELEPGKQKDVKELKDFRITAGQGRFIAESGSDASILLLQLKSALEAKTLPSKIHRVANLPFTYVNFGGNMSKASGGGLNVNPPGDWTAFKVFLGSGEQESQFFINVNPVIGKAEFSIKDEEYGDKALAELAKVL